MMGMSSPEWSRYMHDDVGAARDARRDQRRGRRADARRATASAAADRRARSRRSAARRALAARTRLVVEPPADRPRARARRASRRSSRDGLVGGGRARQAGAGRLPRGGAPPRRRARALRGGRGLARRHPLGEGGGHARRRDPEPALPAGRRGARARRTSCSRSLAELHAGSSSTEDVSRARPNRTQPLWPPRPIAFESATSTCTSPRLVRDVVEVALGVGLAVVDRRRQDAVVEREHAHHRLDRAGRAEGVAHHRLRRRDRELVGVVAEDVLDRLRLGRVAERRRRAVRVDVADALGLDARALERRRASSPRRRSPRARAARGGARRSRRRSRAPRRRSSAPRALGALPVLEHERARALGHHEPGARRVERPRGARRVLVLGGEAAHRGEAGEDQRDRCTPRCRRRAPRRRRRA